jgi:hypothetical protein
MKRLKETIYSWFEERALPVLDEEDLVANTKPLTHAVLSVTPTKKVKTG